MFDVFTEITSLYKYPFQFFISSLSHSDLYCHHHDLIVQMLILGSTKKLESHIKPHLEKAAASIVYTH